MTTHSNWLPYKDARAYARKLGLTSFKAWLAYVKEVDLPEGIPNAPHRVYKEFKAADFLNSRVHQRRARKQRSKQLTEDKKQSNVVNMGFLPFNQARAFVHALNLSSSKIYTTWYKQYGDSYPEIPSRPHRSYHKDWKGWPDFLGTDSAATHFTDKEFCTYIEAKKFTQGLGLKTAAQWREWCRNNPDIRLDIPRIPQKAYNDWWEGWDAFLGTDIVDVMATRQTQLAVLYIAHEPDNPGNVYTIGVDMNGTNSVYDNLVLRKKAKLLKLYEVNNKVNDKGYTLVDVINYIIQANGTNYIHGRDNQWLISNIHQLCWDISDVCDELSINIPKQMMSQMVKQTLKNQSEVSEIEEAMFGDLIDL